MLKYRKRTFHIGDHTIRLKTLRNLAQFADEDGRAGARGISQEAFPVFGMVWPSSEMLATLLLDEDIAGRRILEVGCGMALASHLLNARGADITAMDIHPLAAELLETNRKLNGTSPIPFVDGSWADNHAGLGKFDLIIAGDVLYEPRHVKTLPNFLDRHIGPGGELLIADPARGQLDMFEDMMVAQGFSMREESQPANYSAFDGKVVRFRRG